MGCHPEQHFPPFRRPDAHRRHTGRREHHHRQDRLSVYPCGWQPARDRGPGHSQPRCAALQHHSLAAHHVPSAASIGQPACRHRAHDVQHRRRDDTHRVAHIGAVGLQPAYAHAASVDRGTSSCQPVARLPPVVADFYHKGQDGEYMDVQRLPWGCQILARRSAVDI